MALRKATCWRYSRSMGKLLMSTWSGKSAVDGRGESPLNVPTVSRHLLAGIRIQASLRGLRSWRTRTSAAPIWLSTI